MKTYIPLVNSFQSPKEIAKQEDDHHTNIKYAFGFPCPSPIIPKATFFEVCLSYCQERFFNSIQPNLTHSFDLANKEQAYILPSMCESKGEEERKQRARIHLLFLSFYQSWVLWTLVLQVCSSTRMQYKLGTCSVFPIQAVGYGLHSIRTNLYKFLMNLFYFIVMNLFYFII